MEGMSACRSANVAALARRMRAPAQPHGKDRGAFYSRRCSKQAAYQIRQATIAVKTDDLLRNSEESLTRRSGQPREQIPTFVCGYLCEGDNAVEIVGQRLKAGALIDDRTRGRLVRATSRGQRQIVGYRPDGQNRRFGVSGEN